MYKQQKNGTYELFRSCELNAQLMLVLVLVQLLLHIAAAPVSSIAQGNARELCWLKPAHDYRSRLSLIKNQGFNSIKSNNHATIDMTNKNRI